ncbi:MAG: diguanylate cyclase [Candidatus Sericytochromatia bacterium]|nr:diguanylate cyclase [Candidatus Sericytochromatia bacterium]
MKQQFKSVFLKNTPVFVSMMGVLFALLLISAYLGGGMQGLESTIQDSYFKTRFINAKPHPDIVLVGLDDATTAKMGYPIARTEYAKFLNMLSEQGAKAVGFNILFGSPNKDPKVDQQLFDAVAKSKNVVMPFFYDYSNGNTNAPMPKLQELIYALGNVSSYPGDTTHFIEAQAINQKAVPRQVIFPMGLELARLYLGLEASDIQIQEGQMLLGKHSRFPLESDLIRLHYQGPPGFFPMVSFADAVSGNAKINFKDKVVLIGVYSPTLGDVTTSPFGDQASKPMYGIEIQAHLIQSLIDKKPLYHASPMVIIIVLLLIGASAGLFLPRFAISHQWAILTGLSVFSLLMGFLLFNVAHLLIDIVPVFCFSIMMGAGVTIMISVRSNLALNEQIQGIQEDQRKTPKQNFNQKIEHTLTALLYISQAAWVCYREYNSDKKQMVLREVKSRDGKYTEDGQGDSDEELDEKDLPTRYEHLPPYYQALSPQEVPVRAVPLDFQRLPDSLKEAYTTHLDFKRRYGQLKDSQFVLLPFFDPHRQLIGIFEIFYPVKLEMDDLSGQLLENIHNAATTALTQTFAKEGPARDLIPGVEEKIEALRQLRKQTQDDALFFQTVLQSTTNPVVVCNQLGEINFYNENFVHTLRLSEDLNLTHANIIQLLGRVFNMQSQQWQDIWQTTVFRRKQKEVQVTTEWGVYHLSLTPVIDKRAEVTGVVMVLTDVTKLHRQANFDKLTGLYNRRYFDELLMKEFQRCQRNPDKPFSILLMDIDHFKSFNDTYGHQVGDQVLASFGQVLAKTVRRTDMPVRYGGEEMVVILPDTKADQAAIAAEKIRKVVESMQLYDLEGNPIRQITTSIGVAQYTPRDLKSEDLVRRADDALYKCKGSGRNCIHIHWDSQGISKYHPGQMTSVT